MPRIGRVELILDILLGGKGLVVNIRIGILLEWVKTLINLP